jgi:hypothetical protein
MEDDLSDEEESEQGFTADEVPLTAKLEDSTPQIPSGVELGS